MTTISLFQKLPTPIVDTIIEYLEGHSRVPSSKLMVNKSCVRRSHLFPLTKVGAVWRSAALSQLCETCEVNDSGPVYYYMTFPALGRHSPHMLYHAAQFVKQVVSTISCHHINAAIEVGNRPGYETLSFPSATTFKLTLHDLDKYSGIRYFRLGTRPSAGFSSDALVRLAMSHLRLAPTAVNIGVSVLCADHPGSSVERLSDILLSELCMVHPASRIGIDAWRDSNPILLELHGVVELTSMSGSSNECTSFALLAYLNSHTLTTLHAKIQHESDWLELIYGDTTMPAIFTCLNTLTLDLTQSKYNDEWDKTSDIAMFPNLSTLEVTGSYPFTDDLLFRGNGATLQTLYLPFKTIADNTLGELGILERKGVTKMKKIRFGNVTERDKIIIKGNGRERISQQLDRILEVATGLWLSSDGRKYEVYLSMIRTTCVANVRYLDFCKLTFRHDHVIRTIRALPNLVSFTVAITHISEHGPISDYIKKASDLYKRYYPQGSNFRLLCVPHLPRNSGDDIAKEAIRIAIVCKNPVQFHVPPHEHHRFKHTVSRAIASDEFAPYADSLRHLL